MRITFVLPTLSPDPVGGYKVVYEYANGLHRRGHRVTLVHPQRRAGPAHARDYLRWSRRRLRGADVTWFNLEPGVHVKYVPDLTPPRIPEGDAVIATAWRTAVAVNGLGPGKGRQYYLIQHYETWDGPESEVAATWRFPMHKIAISRWLFDIGVALGERSRVTYIPNGLDFGHLRLTVPIEERGPRVAMMCHPAGWKGTGDGMAALAAARARVPEMEVICFGTRSRDPGWPDWISYVQSPDPHELVKLYNSSSVFLHPSWAEGWPLPPAEAMACGCAVVGAANEGVRDYATDGDTALLAPVKDFSALSRQLIRALRNDSLRWRIARTGYKQIHTYTWQRAVDALEKLLSSDG